MLFDIGVDAMSVVKRIIAERPWILLVLLKALDMGSGSFTARDIAEPLGLNTYVVQRALWWLKKYGFVEEVPGTVPRRYKLKSVSDDLLSEIRAYRWVCGNTIVVRARDLYVVFIVRGRDEVLTRVVPASIVECVEKILSSSGEEDVSRIASMCGVDEPTAKHALRVVRTLRCRG